MIRVKTTTGVKAAAEISIRDAAAALKVVANVRVRDAANALKLVYSSSATGAFTVSASPLTAFGARTGAGPLAITSEEVAVTITGGAAPYTYLWSEVSALSGTWSIQNSTSDRTRFTCSGVPLGDSYVAEFKCTVTDARGVSSDSATVTVTCTNYGDLGGLLP